MKYSKTVVAAVAAFGVLSLGAGTLYAAQNPEYGKGFGQSRLVSSIAKKFNVNESEVQKVFDENRAQMETARWQEAQTRLKERLSDAVTAGKLTQAQADAIVAKEAEIHTAMQSLVGKTREEREAAMQAQRDALKQWAAAQNIPTEYLPMLGMGGGPRGMGMMEGKGMRGGEFLAEAVKNGKITEAQADAIKAKHDELRTFMQSLSGKTEAERQAALKTKTDELKAWAKSQGIPTEYAVPAGGMMGGMMGGRGGHGGRGMMGR